jgi:environmental stress-induced protein Ves
MRVYTEDEFTDMPWKNGVGATQELVRFPPTGDFELRLSMATVATDGLFSRYPGIDRWLLILGGAGCRLRFPDRERVLRPDGEVLAFAGEEDVSCQLLAGAVTDFNVMVRRGYGRMEVTWWPRRTRHACRGEELFLFAPEERKLYHLVLGEAAEIAAPHVRVERYRSE